MGGVALTDLDQHLGGEKVLDENKIQEAMTLVPSWLLSLLSKVLPLVGEGRAGFMSDVLGGTDYQHYVKCATL